MPVDLLEKQPRDLLAERKELPQEEPVDLFQQANLSKFSELSPVGKLLDIVGRPGYAVKSAIAEVQREEAGVPKDILKATMRGFKGDEKYTANELWAKAGVSGVPMLGFATEVGLDPLMFMGGAGYKAIPKTISFLSQQTRKIPGIEGVIQSAREATRPVTETLRKVFVDKSNIPELTAMIDKHLSKRNYLRGKHFEFGLHVRNEIQNISGKHKIPIPELEKRLIDVIEQPNLQENIPELQKLAFVVKDSLSEMLTQEMKAGVSISALSQGNRAIEYFPRIAKSDVSKYLKQAKVGNAKIWNPRLANAIQRKTGDFTLGEFNDLVKAEGLESLGGKQFEEFFLRKPAEAFVIRGGRSAKAVTSAEFLSDAARQFGKTTAPNHWQTLPSTVTDIMPSLKGVKFDPNIADELNRVHQKYINPTEPVNFIKVFDNIQNMWKQWTLAPFPKYHFRNMAGNMWNNYLAGVNPTNYIKAQALQTYRKFREPGGLKKDLALKELDSFGISPQTADGLIKDAEELAVLNQGWYGADIETAVESAFKQYSSPIGHAMRFGKTIENNARLAHYLDRVGKGDSSVNAALSVKKYLFDYTDLTDFERQILKRVMPFYTWTRKNLPLQLQSIWEQPQKFAPISYQMRDRNSGDLLRLKYSRPDIYDSLPVELRRTVDTVTYIPLEGLLPAADLSKMARPQEIVLGLLSPYIKTPIELAFNKNLYFGNEIQRYPKQTQELLRLDLPVKTKYALTTLLPHGRILREVDKLVRKKKVGETLTGGEQAFAQTLSSVYKFTLEDLRKSAIIKLKGDIKDLEKATYSAKLNNRPNEIQVIKNQIAEVKDIIRKVNE